MNLNILWRLSVYRLAIISVSSPEDRRERSLNVAYVAGHGGSRARLGVVGRPEPFPFIFDSFDRHLARNWLLGILLVEWEGRKSRVVATARWVRWPEGLFVHHSGCSLRLESAFYHGRVLRKNSLVAVERISPLGLLGERLVLQHAVMVLAFGQSELLGPVVVVFNVGNTCAILTC